MDTAVAFAELDRLLGERFDTSDAVRQHHGRDESPLPPAQPDAVAFPESTAEVSEIVRICSSARVPVVPFGAGTSLEGHVLATSGGVAVDLTRMNHVVAVNPADLDATVEAGVTRRSLNERLAADGLFFPVDPGADATLGGMTATGASGTTTVRYGAMRQNVLALEVVLPDGRIVETSSRARKSSAGYDLTRLFIGSEGTLGIITGITLRVYGIPEAISGAMCQFPSIEKAVAAVIAILQLGIPVTRIELLDEMSMKAINGYSSTSYPVAPSLFFEFHGARNEVDQQNRDVLQVVEDFGAADYRSSIEGAERTHLWRARHDHFYATRALRPGARIVTTDVCVPISRLAECIVQAQQDIERLSLLATIVGHVGDGNFHVAILVDPDDPSEPASAEELNQRLVAKALEAGGTCTGEHGIGIRKMGFLEQELAGGVEVMRTIKRALDPHNIMNPGKVLALD